MHNFRKIFFTKHISILLAEVCLRGKFNPFSNISQNSILEKRTFLKIQYEENRLFSKFNKKKMDSSQNLILFMFYVFRRMLRLVRRFLEVTNAPCPFSTISRVKKPDSAKYHEMLFEKYVFENSCTQKQQIMQQNTILFLDGETLKDLNNFWCWDWDVSPIAAHSSEKFSTIHYFKTIQFPSRKNAKFIFKLPFCFFMKKHLLKEVVSF